MIVHQHRAVFENAVGRPGKLDAIPPPLELGGTQRIQDDLKTRGLPLDRVGALRLLDNGGRLELSPPGHQPRSGNRRLVHPVGSQPTNRQVVSASPFLHQGFHVVALPGIQEDRLRLLTRFHGPIPGGRPTGHPGDPAPVGHGLVGAQPQFAGIIRSDPKPVVAGNRRQQIPAQSLSILLEDIRRRFKGLGHITRAGRKIRINGGTGQI